MNPILQTIQQLNNTKNIIKQLKSNDPSVMFSQMMENNPEFRKFIEENKDKSPEQIAEEHNIDINGLIAMWK